MYKAIYQDKVIAVSEKKETIVHTEDGDTIQEITGEALFPCLVYDEVVEDTEHNLDDFIHVDGEFVLKTDDKAIEVMKEQVRAVREQYFDEYVDFYQSKPLYWEELEETLKQDITDYRNYLKDYTKEDNWWEQNPLTFDEWKEQKDELGATS